VQEVLLAESHEGRL